MKLHKALIHAKGDEELQVLDGVEMAVSSNFLGEDYIPVSWKKEDDENVMEFFYSAEQDPMFGTYVDDREEFLKDWAEGEYAPAGILTVPEDNVEILESLKAEGESE